MHQPNDNELLEQFLEHTLNINPETAAVLRKMSDVHGTTAALDALLLVLIKRARGNTPLFSYFRLKWQFIEDHPAAIPLLHKALDTIRLEQLT